MNADHKTAESKLLNKAAATKLAEHATHLKIERRDQPHTKKPCPGCGRAAGSRPVAVVCHECRKLLAEAIEQRRATMRQPEYQPYTVALTSYYEGHSRDGEHPRQSDYDDLGDALDRGLSATAIIQELMRRLTPALAAPLPTAGHYTHDTERLYPPSEYSGAADEIFWLKPADAELLRLLNRSIRAALRDRSEAGVEHGRNLLVQVAAGELSLNDFDEKVAANVAQARRNRGK